MAQDPISNNAPFGEYTSSGQDVIINNAPNFNPLTGNPNMIGSNTQLNFIGGNGNDITGPNDPAINSIVYGKNNLLQGSENSAIFGRDNDNISSSSSAIFGRSNVIDDTDECFAAGTNNDISISNTGITIGKGNVINEVNQAVGIGTGTKIQGSSSSSQERIVIGFGDQLNGNFLQDIGNRSITMGTYNNSSGTVFNTFNIQPPSAAGNFSAPVTGIGITGPDAKLSIANTGGSASSTILNLRDNSSNEVFTVKNNGNVGIGTSSPSEKLVVDGVIAPAQDNTYDLGRGGNNNQRRFVDVNITGSVVGGSDRRIKNNIDSLNYGLAEIMKLRPVNYLMKGHSERGTQIGLIAQEVDDVINEVVKTYDGEKGMKGIRYSRIIPVLINGIQEQQKTIQKQEKEVQQLQNDLAEEKQANEELREKVEQLSKQVNQLAEQVNGEQRSFKKQEGETLNQKTVTLSGEDGNQAMLLQNRPNPYSNETVIPYYLPGDVQNANLLITNTQGQMLKRIALDQTGKGELTLRTQDLKKGQYQYTLIVDGQKVKTRNMVIK